MIFVALLLLTTSFITLLLSIFIKRWKAYLILTGVFALINSYIAAPLNWTSAVKGYGFFLPPITAVSPSVPPHKLALPIDSPEVIIHKMGCYICHKIPHISASRFSNIGPVLIPKTTAPQRIASASYQNQVASGKANASTPREYVIESIINPDAYIVPGYEKKDNPEESMMFHHYDKRFTQGGLEKLADHLLTLDVRAAAREGLIFAH